MILRRFAALVFAPLALVLLTAAAPATAGHGGRAAGSPKDIVLEAELSLPAKARFLFAGVHEDSLIYIVPPIEPAVGGEARLWVVAAKTQAENGVTYASLRMAVDCLKLRQHILGGAAYDEADQLLGVQIDVQPWEDIGDNTNARLLLSLGCGADEAKPGLLADRAAFRADLRQRLAAGGK